MSRIPAAVRRYLDVEATADDEYETDEDDADDFQDTFIVDVSDGSNDDIRNLMHAKLRESEKLDKTALLDAFCAKILAKSYEHARTSGNPRPDYELVRLNGHIENASRPGNDEYPLWKISCKIGYEESILIKILELADDRHRIRSCFSRETLRGCFYAECIMNQTLIDLLRRIPGVTCIHKDVKRIAVPPEDWVPLLKMTNPDVDVRPGDWVRIKKGLYKEDSALIHAVESWGVQVLLAPRLAYHPIDKKGKRTVTSLKPMPKLLDAAEYERTTLQIMSHHQDNFCSIGRLHFQHGLLSKAYDFHSIDPRTQDMPNMLFDIFRSSNHPFLANVQMLRPREWSFLEHERVLVRSSSKAGTIVSMQGQYVEINIDSEGIHQIHWFDVYKIITTGDYVCINGGLNTGEKGWVTSAKNGTASILVQGNDEKINHIDTETIEEHINYLMVVDPPFYFMSDSSMHRFRRTSNIKHAWCGTPVLITKLGNPYKGKHGYIKDVSLESSSVAYLSVQISSLDPTRPYPVVIFDHDDVIESSTRLNLTDFFNLSPDVLPTEIVIPTHVALPEGGATPMPSSPCSTPAWNSNLLMPGETPPTLPIRTDHILFKQCLIGVELSVIFNGEGHNNKSMTVNVAPFEGHFRFSYTKYGVAYYPNTAIVTPNYPSPTHYNGLSVVIKGDHSGKFVRRIHHTHERGTQNKFMLAAVVERHLDCPDTITNERLTIDCSLLCIVSESSNSKKLNGDIMSEVRAPYKRAR